MRPLSCLSGAAIPLCLDNIDTDMILPAIYLKGLTRSGLGQSAFAALRFSADGSALPGSLFHLPRFRGAPILIAGENFGCGSSREHAVWALSDLGIRAVVAPSFADIFSGNAFKNGIVLIALPREAIDRLLAVAYDVDLEIDVEAQEVRIASGERFGFELDPFRKRCLLEGSDEIALTEQLEAQISLFQKQAAAARPWLANPRRPHAANTFASDFRGA
jgi:3-isopropylmalate/(R)-2-methylmalate dehydratase small subunit